MTDDKKCSTTCQCCGQSPCVCAKCPGKKIDHALCIILKVLKICALAGLTMVLFDVHGMLKAQKEYANAVTAAVTANAQAQSQAQAPVAATQGQ